MKYALPIRDLFILSKFIYEVSIIFIEPEDEDLVLKIKNFKNK